MSNLLANSSPCACTEQSESAGCHASSVTRYGLKLSEFRCDRHAEHGEHHQYRSPARSNCHSVLQNTQRFQLGRRGGSANRPMTAPPAGPAARMVGSKKSTKKSAVPTQKIPKRIWITRRISMEMSIALSPEVKVLRVFHVCGWHPAQHPSLRMR